MSKGPDVLERKVINPGKAFIKAGEENSRAYIIQNGMVRSFIMLDDEKTEVARYGPGTIIGEACLVLDELIDMNYEALVDTTVVTLTRQDFEKKLTRCDSTVRTILGHLMEKLSALDSTAIGKAKEKADINEKAFQLTRAIVNGFAEEKQRRYEQAILPHMNGLIKAIERIKAEERYERQAAATEEKVNKIKGDG